MIAIERLNDPVRVAGLWVPEMIAIAGGEDVAGDPGLAPAEVSWGELAGLRPEVVIVMVEGYLEDVQAQAMEFWEHIESLGAARVYAVAAQTAFSDAGPRLIDGVELSAPPPPRPDGAAGQHPLHAACAARRPGPPRPSGPPKAGDRQATARARMKLRTPIAAMPPSSIARRELAPVAEAALLGADDQKAAKDTGDQAAHMRSDADLRVGEGEDEVEDDQEADVSGDRLEFAPPGDDEGRAEDPKIAPEAPALTVSGLNQRATNEPARRLAK